MPETIAPASRSERPAHYVTAEDARHYARYFHPVPGGRGWSQALMEENLPGWTLNEFMALCNRHRLFGRDATGEQTWTSPDVVGVVIDGESVIADRGDLEHPAKASAQRRISIGLTSPAVRHLRGDNSPIVVHVRMSAATPDERLLHDAARTAYRAAPVRPSLVMNVDRLLVDPFDPPYTEVAVRETPLDEAMDSFVRQYTADVSHLLEDELARHGKLVLVTMTVHDVGEPLEVVRADKMHLPEPLRSKSLDIVSRVLSIRSDTLLGPRRSETVATLVDLIGESHSFERWARASQRALTGTRTQNRASTSLTRERTNDERLS